MLPHVTRNTMRFRHEGGVLVWQWPLLSDIHAASAYKRVKVTNAVNSIEQNSIEEREPDKPLFIKR